MKYPKLWNGASPLGEALVRSLQRVRSPFLSAKAGDVRANKMGGRSEVFQGDDIGLLSAGATASDGLSKPYRIAAAIQPRRPFHRRRVGSFLCGWKPATRLSGGRQGLHFRALRY